MTIKHMIVLFIISLLTLTVIVFASIRKTVVLKWDYPIDEIPHVSFNIYFNTNLTNATWTLLTNVFGVTSVAVPVVPGNCFFFATASNEFGESIPSNVATATIPRYIRMEAQ